MPYKSKRTRDLQGEVKAGSGISVIENTKPDGTKEYTITNGDPASAITVDGTGLSLISNVLRNTMAAIMGWSGDDSRGAINWTDDNDDTVLKIIPLQELFIGDAKDNNDFIIKHINGENRLIRGTLQIAENIDSTEGVSLNTLANRIIDLSDSAITFSCSYSTNIDNNIAYCAISGYSGIEGKDYKKYYELATSDEQIGGINPEIIKIKQTGRYKIDVFLECGVFDDNYIRNIYFAIFCFRNNGDSDDIIYTEVNTYTSDVASTGKYGGANTVYSIYADLSANDAITCYAYMNTNGTATLGSNETTLSIQKIG